MKHDQHAQELTREQLSSMTGGLRSARGSERLDGGSRGLDEGQEAAVSTAQPTPQIADYQEIDPPCYFVGTCTF